MRQGDKACFVRNGMEIAQEAYKTGFSDELQKRDGVGLDPAIIAGIGICRAKAFECFGRDRFEVQHIPTVGEEQ